jgi:hypothetical protein
MTQDPHTTTRAKKTRRRKAIALGLGGGALIVLSLIRFLYWLTSGVEIHWRDLIFNILVTIVVMMAVELWLEGFSLRSDDLTEVESSVKAILSQLEKVDTEHLVNEVVSIVAKEWKKDKPLVEAGEKYGLEDIYSSRDELQLEILNKVREAKKRIWLLAITFSQGVRAEDELLGVIRDKVRKGVEVRILATNAIRSLAVFRTLLEISSRDVKPMLQGGDGFKHYFDHRFYLKFRQLLIHLDQYFRNYQKIVRFYPHGPSCWLFRVDDDLYYQPYVLGRIDASDFENNNDQEEALTIGELMPVFKFVDPDKKPFQALLNHFDKLWSTSDVDMFHMGARVANKEFRLKRIFKERGLWFEHVVEALRVPQDRRAYPRKLYRKDPSYEVAAGQGNAQATDEWMYWTLSFSEGPLKALCPIRVTMEDVSFGGCALRIDADGELRELFWRFSDKAVQAQVTDPELDTKYLDTRSYRAKCIEEIGRGIATLEPPLVEGLKELEYLIKKMREYCKLEFQIQNWNWDGGNRDGDLLIGMQYPQDVPRLANLPCLPVAEA